MKWVSLIFAAILFLTSGCSSSHNAIPHKVLTSDVYEKDYDMSFEYMRSNNQICRNEAVYYFVQGNEWILFYDNETGITGKLCGKPECTHESVGCNAYMLNGTIQIYNGELYMIQGDILYKMDTSGAQRTKVMELSGIEGMKSWTIHRGCVYIETLKQVVVDGKPYEDYRLSRYKLNGNAKKDMVLQERYEGIVVPRWIIYGNHLCHLVDVDKQSTGMRRDRKVRLYDIQNETWSEIFNNSSKWQILDWNIQKNGLYILEKAWEEIRVIYYDFEKTSVSELFCVEDMSGYVGILTADLSGIILYPKLEMNTYYLYNMEGKQCSLGKITENYWYMEAWGHDQYGYLALTMDSNDYGPVSILWRISEDGIVQLYGEEAKI